MATRKTAARRPAPSRKGSSAPARSRKPVSKPASPKRSLRPRAPAGAVPEKVEAPASPKRSLRPRAPADAVPEKVEAPIERGDPARPRAVEIARAGLDKKAEEVLVLDVRGLTSYADYFVLMTADSDRQAGAIADHVDQKLKEGGSSKVGVEGYESGRWILIDYGDVVAHVFNREARGFYDLEGLWADAPRFTVED